MIIQCIDRSKIRKNIKKTKIMVGFTCIGEFVFVCFNNMLTVACSCRPSIILPVISRNFKSKNEQYTSHLIDVHSDFTNIKS